MIAHTIGQLTTAVKTYLNWGRVAIHRVVFRENAVKGRVVDGRSRISKSSWALAFAALVVLVSSIFYLRSEFHSAPSSANEFAIRKGIVPTRTEDSASSPRTLRSQQGDPSSQSHDSTKLTLRAVHVGATPGGGTADLGNPAGAVRTFVAGAVMRDGARLTEVHTDHVVLEKDGQVHSLLLAR
jgi:hypothetical protein